MESRIQPKFLLRIIYKGSVKRCLQQRLLTKNAFAITYHAPGLITASTKKGMVWFVLICILKWFIIIFAQSNLLDRRQSQIWSFKADYLAVSHFSTKLISGANVEGSFTQMRVQHKSTCNDQA